jgi:hypothetical protein
MAVSPESIDIVALMAAAVSAGLLSFVPMVLRGTSEERLGEGERGSDAVKRWRPLEQRVALAVVVMAVLLEFGSGWFLFETALGTRSLSWLVVGLLVAAVIVGRLAWAELVGWERVRERFLTELRTAEAELTVLGAAPVRAAWSRKWFIRLLRDEKRIQESYAERMAESGWITFLENHAALGGARILEFYRSEMELLQIARDYDATVSFHEYYAGRLRDNLYLAGLQRKGEEEIERDLEKLRHGSEPEAPWEQLL